jgi:hypothetical protein
VLGSELGKKLFGARGAVCGAQAAVDEGHLARQARAEA